MATEGLSIWHEWLCKTNFSFLQAASHPEELIQRAEQLSYRSLAINDFDGVYGVARSYNRWRELQKTAALSKINSNLKLHYGAEIHWQNDHDSPLVRQKTLALIALNRQGYFQLNQILSFAHGQDHQQAFIPLAELANFSASDLVAIIPQRGGLDFFQQSPEELEGLRSQFQGRLFLALTRQWHPDEDTRIKTVYHLAQQMGLPILPSQDVFFAKAQDKSFHDVLMAIRHNRPLHQSLPFLFANRERHLHSLSQLQHTYAKLPGFASMLNHTQELAEACQFCPSQLRYHYPREFIPAGETAQSYLQKMTDLGLKQRYPLGAPDQVLQLIDKELRLIEDLQFADYFLTVWDIVRWAREQNILCQGRGSAANSAVCFALGITSCDPALFDLLFERFISKERGDPPDIDVDFEHERREEVIQYIYQRYGRQRAAMVCNVITFRKKGALRAVGKALGVPEAGLSQLAAFAESPHWRSQKLQVWLEEAQKSLPTWPLPFTWQRWAEFSSRLKGFPRHLGLHSGGFVISQHPIDQLVAQEPATKEGRTVIQWCKDDIEELGFFKIDCLALGMLTALRKTLQLIEVHHKKSLPFHQIPNDDPQTYQLIQAADTLGVFQIESRAQMSLLPRLKPREFYDLVIQIAIVRPGPIQGKVIHPFLRRRQGLEPVSYAHPALSKILHRTLGVILFQEQLMRVAIALGDFTPGEANELRKHIGSWNSKTFDRNLSPYLKKLWQGLKREKVSDEFIEQTLEQMKGFAQYGFPESHAISFAFLAYASCYLKAHYPVAFYVALLNSQPMGFYSPHAILQEARRKGFVIQACCVWQSVWDHQMEEGTDGQWGIRLGFRLVKGLSEKCVQHLLHQRSQRQHLWSDLSEFVNEVKLGRDDYFALAAADSFQIMGIRRAEAFWFLSAHPFHSALDQEGESEALQWPQIPWQELQNDFASLGTSLKDHPCRLIREEHWPYPFSAQKLTPIGELAKFPNKTKAKIFGLQIVKQAPPSAKGMVFLTLEDETGLINVAISPKVYKRDHSVLESSRFICLQGQVQSHQGTLSFWVDRVEAPGPLPRKRPLAQPGSRQSLTALTPKSRSLVR